MEAKQHDMLVWMFPRCNADVGNGEDDDDFQDSKTLVI